ncbi:MAG: trypsin-like peptidase domain-containing protein [Vicinamibacterales bacterium]
MAPRRLVFAVLLLTCGFAVGIVVTGRMRTGTSDASAQAPAQGTPRVVTPAGPAGSGGGLPDFTTVAGRTVPVVANISSQQVVRRSNSPFANDPFFRFFGDDQMFGSRRSVESSLGSGVIISADGYILTNNHVVAGESGRISIEQLPAISVSLGDGRELNATIVGVDAATDLALLKINARNLPTMPWGDSSKLKVAEWVLAIGNPFQLNQTVTLGIVSALGRRVGISAYEDFIQTDAAINPGNSGGALINARGELIGINTAIFSQSGGYQGIGFAVPSNLARTVVDELQRFGEVRRGSVGDVEISPITPQLAAQLGAPEDTRGVLVQRMRRDSAAYDGGIRPGDIIVAFGGMPIGDGAQLSRLIQDAKIGSTASISVLREGRRVELKIPIRSGSGN